MSSIKMFKNVQKYIDYILLYFLTILSLVADRPVTTATFSLREFYSCVVFWSLYRSGAMATASSK